ncbi:helix-turn-helix transcriptional regulator [Sulfitobacter dubius]|uniref:helix-turn-helix transcriptional regulator n=1 Tax=Sulfitobacter dubius TaxID=218673 RepID=UPI002941FAE3|nr:transcriptional regulator [Sulfitobacter dubius]WOI29358.1 transcriptional regulator [Sulfitobacter dubius]
MSNLLPAAAVREKFGVTDMTLWRWLDDEELSFPRPIYIKRNRYWREDDLAAWLSEQTQG